MPVNTYILQIYMIMMNKTNILMQNIRLCLK